MRFALVSFGNEENYGLLFVGTELKKYGETKFFDNEASNCLDDIIDYKPAYVCFSPMTTFYRDAKRLENGIKKKIDVVSIYGGHHASNCGYDCGDITVIGRVYNLDLSKRGKVFNGPTRPEDLKIPAREEYYRDIPRFKSRYRKMMLSVVGCPFNCSYCSSSSSTTRKLYGNSKYHLRHRDINTIIKEAKYIKDTTHEIEWVDDDIFFSDEEWLRNFLNKWIKEINIPMYVSATSLNALKASDEILELLRKTCNCIGIGVQSINPKTLKLIHRNWETKEKLITVYERLKIFGFNVNFQMIAGFPINDPVGDALETLKFLRDIAKGSIISCYPLQIYPNTELEAYCKGKYKLNEACVGDTNTGTLAIDFGDKINNRIKNISKLGTLIVKYGLSDKWIDALLDIDLPEDSSKKISTAKYYECIKDRLADKADAIFNDVLTSMKVRY